MNISFNGLRKLFLLLILNAVMIYIMLSTIFLVRPQANEAAIFPKTCGIYPQEEDIFIDNIVWQVFETPMGFIKLLNAYVDRRWNQTDIIINGNGPKTAWHPRRMKVFCQFWFDDTSEPLIVNASTIQSLWVDRKLFSLRFLKY